MCDLCCPIHAIRHADPFRNTFQRNYVKINKNFHLRMVIWDCRMENVGFPLQWLQNGSDGVSNHQPHHCLLNRLFRRRSNEISKLSVTGLCVGNSPVTGEFPAQKTSDAENVSIWWRHHVVHASVCFLFQSCRQHSYQLMCCLLRWHQENRRTMWWIFTKHGPTSMMRFVGADINMLRAWVSNYI